MKLADLRNPVRFNWLEDQGFRLLASPYLSGAYEARKFLEQLPVPTTPLCELTTGYEGGIYNGPQFRRNYVSDREYGVPFLGSTDIMMADFTNIPLLQAKDAHSGKLAHLEVKPGMTLISCSGTVGRTCYVRPDMARFWSSQDVLKVVPSSKISAGYMYTFLNSRFGIPMVTSQASGSMIQHLEPVHIANLPVPRFDAAVEQEIHDHIQAAANLRARFQAGVTAATCDLFESAGLPELLDLRWHEQSRDIGFTVAKLTPTTLRAANLAPRMGQIIEKLASVPNRALGDICASGQLSRGNRFARIDSEPGYGYRLIGQRQGPWLRPEGRWVALKPEILDEVRAADESVLVASQGTLGESEVFCRSIFITGFWQREFVFSEHFLRIVSGDADFPGAYLFAFLRSEPVFRIFRSMSTGSKQQDIHEELRAQIPVPECTPADRERIAETVRQAYRWRDEADELEDRAQELLEAAVRDAAGADLRQDGGLTPGSLVKEAHGSGDG
jgi:type I restriction enzyme S subunit